jgi:hypothetical protein
MANRRFIDFPIASTVGDNDIVLIWQDGLNKQTTKGTLIQGAPTSLEGLTDVDIAGLINGQILQYNSVTGKWENVDRTGLNLSELGDVSIVSPSNGQVLVYNSTTSKWENSSAGFVPYVGAVTTVDLGAQGLRAGYVRFNTSVVSVPDEQGLMYWDGDDETIAVILNGYIMKVGEDQFYPVKNQTGSSIAKGTAVRFAGTIGASGRLLIAPFIADGSVSSSFFMGVTAEAIANGADGKVLYFGRIRGINTNAFNEGDVLYASTTVAGGFQTAVPVAPNNIVQVAAVINKSINQGVIFIRPSFGSNINQDEGVKIVSPTTGQLLQLQANGLWENKTTAQVLGGTSSQFVKGDGTLDSNTYQVTSEKGQPNGYASLDSNGKVPLVQINDALIGNVNFQGLWNAATNTPTLANPPASGTKGHYYIVSTAGTFASISFEVGDWIISDGTAWGKVDNTDAVSSVFGRTGNVTAANGDYTTAQVTESGNLYYTDGRARAAISLTTTGASGSSTYNNSTGVLNVPAYTLSGLGGIGGTIASGQVAFGTAANTIGGDAAFTWDNTNKILSVVKRNAGTALIVDNNGSFSFEGILIKGGNINDNFALRIQSSNESKKVLLRTNANGFLINVETSNNLEFATANFTRWIITNTGILQSNGVQTIQTSTGALTLQSGNRNVLINTTTDAGFRLDVNGTGRFSEDTDFQDGIRAFGALQFRYSNVFRGQIVPYNVYGGGSDFSPFFTSETSLAFGVAGNATKALNIASTGAATFSSSVTATSFSNAGLQSGEVFNATKSNAGYFVGYFQNTSATGLGLNIQNGNDANDSIRISNAAGTANNILFYGDGKAYFAGNVGIGTTSPNSPLHVVNSSNGFIQRFAGGTSSAITGGIFAEIGRNFASIGTISNHGFNIFTNDNDRLAITSGGNVLIGTTTDTGGDRRLQVAGNLFVDDNTTTGNGVQLKNADRPLITRGWDAFTSGNKTGVGRWGVYMESAELFLGSPGTDYSGGLVTIGGWLVNGTRQPNLTVNNQTRNVLIGTTTDTGARLFVNGGDIGISQGNGLRLIAPNGVQYRVTVNNSGTLITTAI